MSMYRCTIVKLHPPLNALDRKGSEVLHTRLCTWDNVHALTSGSPMFLVTPDVPAAFIAFLPT